MKHISFDPRFINAAGSGRIFSPIEGTNRFDESKQIGKFSHYKNRQDLLVGLQVENGPEMTITHDTITVDGYEKPWVSVTYMKTNEMRRVCAEWVWYLICEGRFEQHRKNEDETQ